MEGQSVDNSVSSAPAPVAPVVEAAPAAPQVTPTGALAQQGPPSRDPALLDAIFNGADPETFGQAGQPAPQAPAQEAPPAPADPGSLIPDKFKNPDGTPNVEAIAKSYSQLERAFGEQGNKLGTVTQQLQELATRAQAPAPAPQAQPEPVDDTPKFPWEEQLSPEDREKALEEYYADPLAAQEARDKKTIKAMEHRMTKTLESVLKPLAPVLQKHQYDTEVSNYETKINDFAASHPDIDEVIPAMESMAKSIGHEAIKAMEKAGKNPLEALYSAAKALKGPPQAVPPTPAQMIADPNYRQQIVADQGIKNEILKSTMSDIKGGQPPAVIGSQAGIPPATPSDKPKSAREATSMLQRMLLRS